jgi:hypothetical protein
MATVLEEYITEEQRSIMRFMGKRTGAKDIFREIFPVYIGKCLSRKRLATGG